MWENTLVGMEGSCRGNCRMLLQTNSYIVPKDRRAEHARLLRRFRQTLARLGCEHFEVYEQVGQNWSAEQTSGRFVQIMRFRDRRHQLAVQSAERTDPTAQRLIAEFCDIINFPYQQQHGMFAVGFYTRALPAAPSRPAERDGEEESSAEQAAVTPSPQTTAAAPTSHEPADVAAPAVDSTSEADAAPAAHAGEEIGAVLERVDAIDEPAESEPRHIAEVDHGAASGMPEAGDEMAVPTVTSEQSEHEAGTNGDSAALVAEEQSPDRCAPSIVRDPPDELGPRSEDHFSPQADANPVAYGNGERVAVHGNGEAKAAAGGSGIGEVLDRGGSDIDDLDFPLPAELIDEPDEIDVPVPQHGGHVADESGHSR